MHPPDRANTSDLQRDGQTINRFAKESRFVLSGHAGHERSEKIVGPLRTSDTHGDKSTKNSLGAPDNGSHVEGKSAAPIKTMATAATASRSKETKEATSVFHLCDICDSWTVSDGHLVNVTMNGDTFTGIITPTGFVPFATLPVYSTGFAPPKGFTGMVFNPKIGSYTYWTNGQDTVFGNGVGGGVYGNGPVANVAPINSPSNTPSVTTPPPPTSFPEVGSSSAATIPSLTNMAPPSSGTPTYSNSTSQTSIIGSDLSQVSSGSGNSLSTLNAVSSTLSSAVTDAVQSVISSADFSPSSGSLYSQFNSLAGAATDTAFSAAQNVSATTSQIVGAYKGGDGLVLLGVGVAVLGAVSGVGEVAGVIGLGLELAGAFQGISAK